mmetsp:Transcript_65563/g.137053  ORF Transcript_65563/g.137053 Transcript_65563/m.137053 type:complete len:358 (+) Transcript_65563:91-1164(+)
MASNVLTGRAGPFFMCSCRLERNFFVKSLVEHFEYKGDDAAFERQYFRVVSEKGDHLEVVPPVEVVLDEIKAQREERRRQPEEAETRAAKIASDYKRLHPEVFKMDSQRFIHPTFREIVDLMSKCPEKPRAIESCIQNLCSRGCLTKVKKDIWTFPVFTTEFCDLLEAELTNFEQSGLPAARPNTMNRFGVLLRELGMCEELLDPFVAECLNPVAVRLLCNHTEALDSYRPFTVKYEATAEGDRDLNLHYDNSEVTLNVNIGGQWTGGEVTFFGLGGPAYGSDDHSPYPVKLNRGHGALHSGRELHQAEPVAEGKRHNLILWCRSSGVRNGECPMCWRVPNLVPTNMFAHEGFTGPP